MSHLDLRNLSIPGLHSQFIHKTSIHATMIFATAGETQINITNTEAYICCKSSEENNDKYFSLVSDLKVFPK